jgi:hypothetical protein
MVCSLPSSVLARSGSNAAAGPGYCVVIWRPGHVAEPTDVDADAAGQYWADVLAVSRAIESEFGRQDQPLHLGELGAPPSHPRRSPLRRRPSPGWPDHLG